VGLSEDQLRERRSYLGGTDLAALAGVNPPGWAKPIDVWLDKRGELPPRSSPQMSLGSLLEPVVIDLFREATGMRVLRHTQPVRDRHQPWLGGHVDGYTGDWGGGSRPDAGGVLECKWAMRSDAWGPTVTNQEALDGVAPTVPAHYMVQLQHYLGVTRRPWGYLAVLLGYADFRWYAVRADQETIGMLQELGRRFWHENVLAGVPPEEDGSESYGAWLARRWAKDAGVEAVATPAQAVYWRDWLEADTQVRTAELQREQAKQRLQDSMGATAKLVLPDGGHVTWRTQERRTVDWEAVATQLAKGHKKYLAELARTHTTVTTTRPWRPQPAKQED
jgi:predicted phage-related endonuclease